MIRLFSRNIDEKTGLPVDKTKTTIVLSIVISATLCIYILKLFSLQIIEGAQYQRQSSFISSRVQVITAQRGEIFDRNGTVPIASNIDSWAVDIVPAEIPSERFDDVLARLAGYL
ncbi:MAG: penicillin-binding protein 2, partial [Spirochaetales bacterium]